MSSIDIGARLQKLRDLREKLCNKEKNWDEAFKARDWIVEQLKSVQEMAKSEVSTKDDINSRLADILCVLSPNDGDNDDNG